MHHLGDDDPRDKLKKARLWELRKFAHQHGVSEVEEDMGATLIRKILRSRGLTNIDIPARRLGQPDRPNGTERPLPVSEADVVEIDAEEDLMRQWQMQKARKAQKPRKETGFTKLAKLRTQAKALGIKTERTWKTADYVKAIEAASHDTHAA